MATLKELMAAGDEQGVLKKHAEISRKPFYPTSLAEAKKLEKYEKSRALKEVPSSMQASALPMPKTRKAAEEIAGTLSHHSKMPDAAFGLSAYDCKTGSILRRVNGSVCTDCYAMGGQNVQKNVQDSYKGRLDKLRAAMKTPESQAAWSGAVAKLIQAEGVKHFRWHDSGDIQSPLHLKMMADVASATPDVKHWVPTKELEMVRRYHEAGGKIPPNMLLRYSSPQMDQEPLPSEHMPNTSTVSKSKPVPAGSHNCPAIHDPKQYKVINGKNVPNCSGTDGGGIDCKACWSPHVKNVNYEAH